MSDAREEFRIRRVVENLRRHYQYGHGLNVTNYLPYNGIGDILIDQDERVYYGDLNPTGSSSHSGDSDYSWSRAVDILVERNVYGSEKFGTPMVEFPLTTYSDYSGSTLERSNCNVLLDESSTLRPFLRETYGGMGTRGVVIPLAFLTDWKYSGEWVAELHRTLDALSDYPLLDESDQYELEMILITEAIDNYGLFDVKREAEALIRKALISPVSAVNDAFDDVCTDIIERFDDSTNDQDPEYRQWFVDVLSNSDHYPHCEDAVGAVHWEGVDDEASALLASAWVTTGRLPWVKA